MRKRDIISASFREKRGSFLREFITRENVRTILDIGGRSDYWKSLGEEFIRKRSLEITLLNPALSEMEGAKVHFAEVVGDGRCVEAPSASFDLVHSNSTIEHLGAISEMRLFASEVSRLGRCYYVQTPNFWFPIEPHFPTAPAIHWMPKALRTYILATFPVSYAGRLNFEAARNKVNEVRLLSSHDMKALFPDAVIRRERFFGFTKSLIAVRATVPAS